MDNETNLFKNNNRAASSDAPTNTNTLAASSDAPTDTNTTKAASSDAPNTTPASQDAPKRQPPKAAFSGKTNKKKRSAASKDAMSKATARSAPNQVASQATPTPSATKEAPPNTTLNTGPRPVLEHGDSKRPADEGAPTTRAAPTAAASERDLTSLAEAPLTGTPTPNTTWKTITRKTSSKRRLSTIAEAGCQDVVADTGARGQPAGSGHCPAVVSKTTGTTAGAGATVVKRKRGRKSRGGQKLTKTGGGPDARAQKRSRPEDSVTPTGVGKKSKTARSPMVDGSLVTYAEAAAAYKSNELCVAVMTEPFQDMTQEQAEGIRLNIENQLRALLMADPDPTNPTCNTAIHFRGKAHFAEGVLKTWCEDNFTLAWLKRIIANMTSPLPGTKLTVRPQAEIPKKTLCMLYVPENTEDTPALVKLLSRQNANLKINTWTLTHGRVRQEPPGTCLFFRVPESIVKIIKDQQRRVYYLMGSIYIRFLEETVPSEGSTAPSTSSAPVAPELTLDTPLPMRSSSPPAMEGVEDLVEKATTMAITEVDETSDPTQDPPSPGLTSDEDCFPTGEEREENDSSLCSSPLREL